MCYDALRLEEAADTEAVGGILHATVHLLHEPQRPAVPPPRHCLFKDNRHTCSLSLSGS